MGPVPLERRERGAFSNRQLACRPPLWGARVAVPLSRGAELSSVSLPARPNSRYPDRVCFRFQPIASNNPNRPVWLLIVLTLGLSCSESRLFAVVVVVVVVAGRRSEATM